VSRKSPWKSRKFWVALVTLVSMLVSHFAGVELDAEEILAIVLPAVAYILGEAWVDSRKREE